MASVNMLLNKETKEETFDINALTLVVNIRNIDQHYTVKVSDQNSEYHSKCVSVQVGKMFLEIFFFFDFMILTN